jgi:DNA-directed RNA polymerase subunit M/transcription elongation factor TFIIS
MNIEDFNKIKSCLDILLTFCPDCGSNLIKRLDKNSQIMECRNCDSQWNRLDPLYNQIRVSFFLKNHDFLKEFFVIQKMEKIEFERLISSNYTQPNLPQ